MHHRNIYSKAELQKYILQGRASMNVIRKKQTDKHAVGTID